MDHDTSWYFPFIIMFSFISGVVVLFASYSVYKTSTVVIFAVINSIITIIAALFVAFFIGFYIFNWIILPLFGKLPFAYISEDNIPLISKELLFLNFRLTIAIRKIKPLDPDLEKDSSRPPL